MKNIPTYKELPAQNSALKKQLKYLGNQLDYVIGIKNNPIARKVKLADLKHNSDLSRLDKIDDKAL